MYFEVTVSLPASSAFSPLEIKAFDTDLHNFGQKVGDLNDKVAFGTLALRSSNGPVEVGSVSANHASVHTSNGAIHGTFNASSHLVLITSNAPIHAEVGLTYTGNEERTTLTLKTNNGFVCLSRFLPDANYGLGSGN